MLARRLLRRHLNRAALSARHLLKPVSRPLRAVLNSWLKTRRFNVPGLMFRRCVACTDQHCWKVRPQGQRQARWRLPKTLWRFFLRLTAAFSQRTVQDNNKRSIALQRLKKTQRLRRPSGSWCLMIPARHRPERTWRKQRLIALKTMQKMRFKTCTKRLKNFRTFPRKLSTRQQNRK